MMWDDKREANFKTTKIIALVAMIAIPAALLALTYAVTAKPQTGGHVDMLLYLLLFVAIFQPATYPFIERFQVDSYKKNQQSQMTVDQLFLNVSVIKFALVEAIFLYGLLNFFISGDLIRMLYFYPIGIAWSFFYWPKRIGYENFVQKMESNIL